MGEDSKSPASAPKRLLHKLARLKITAHRTKTSFDLRGAQEAELLSKRPSEGAAIPTREELASLAELDESDEGPDVELRPFIKVRIVTWSESIPFCTALRRLLMPLHPDMNQSLPTGDLTELLGPLPPDAAATSPDKSPSLQDSKSFKSSTKTHHSTSDTNHRNDQALPKLAMDGNHPFHLLVVGGQEVPQAPMLSEFTLKGSSAWTEMLEDWFCRGEGMKAHGPAADKEKAAPDSASRGAGASPASPSLSQSPIEVKDFGRPFDEQPSSPSMASSPLHHRMSHNSNKAAELPLKRKSTQSAETLASAASSMHEVEGELPQRKQIGPYVLVSKVC